MAIDSFKNRGTEDVFDRRDTKAARRVCPPDLVKVARRKLDQINQAASLNDLRSPPNNNLEPLKGNRGGQHSIRVNDKYRVCFVWRSEGVADQVEITDYH